jgi:hypothetical protein
MSIVETPATDTPNVEAAHNSAVETPASDGQAIRLDELPAKDYNEIRDAQEADKKENGPEFLQDQKTKQPISRAQKAINKITAKHYAALQRAEAAEARAAALEAQIGNSRAATPVAEEEGDAAIPTRESETLFPPDSQDVTPSAESSARPQATPAQRAQYEAEYSRTAQSIPGYAEAEAKADQIGVPESLVDGIRSNVPPSEIPHLIKFLTDNPQVLESLGNDAEPAQAVAKIARDLKAARGNGRAAIPQTQGPNGNVAAQTASPEFVRLQARLQAHNHAIAVATKSMPDFAASVSHLQIAHHVSRAVLETDNSADVVIHLAKNPKELDELNKANAVQAAAKIGRISERLEAAKNAPPKARVNPPPPIRTVGAGGSNISVPLDEMPIKDFMRIRNKQESARKRGGY